MVKFRRLVALSASLFQEETCTNIPPATRGHLVSELAEECGLRNESNKQFSDNFFGM